MGAVVNTDQVLGERHLDGSSTRRGYAYHDTPGFDGPVHRGDAAARARAMIDHAPIALLGAHGLDLGCATGGITLRLAAVGASMVGLDYDAAAVAVAKRCADREGLDARFMVSDIADLEPIGRSDRRPRFAYFDFVVWTSQFMWLRKHHGDEAAHLMLNAIARNVPVLYFETALPGDKAAGRWGQTPDEVVAMLEGRYPTVTEIHRSAGWGNRSLYLAHRCGL